MLNLMKKSFFVVALSLFIAACGSSSTPEGVAEEFISGLYKGQADISKIYLGKDAEKPGAKEMAEGKVKAAAAKAKAQADAKGGLDSIKLADVKTEGNRSTVRLELTFKDGSKDKERVDLYNDNDTWKISLKF